MTDANAGFDLQAAHRHFSADCFNRAWDLIDKQDRSATENEEMLRLSFTSYWHWTQRDDCTPTKLSVACWQLSRVYAVLGQASAAKRYGQLALRQASAPATPPFYRAYAYEALARAAALAGKWPDAERYLSEARKEGERIEKEPSKVALMRDLATILRPPAP